MGGAFKRRRKHVPTVSTGDCDDLHCDALGTLVLDTGTLEVCLCERHRLKLIEILARGGAWFVKEPEA